MTPPRALVLAAALLAGGSVHAAEIVALGASNTEGRGRRRTNDGVPSEQAYPAQLQALLAARGCRARVLNAGVAGDTTGGMLARLPGVLGPETRVLILQPGGNDARRGVGHEREANIEEITRVARSRGIEVIPAGPAFRPARPYLLPDGQHFSAEGHAVVAAGLAPKVLSSAACRR